MSFDRRGFMAPRQCCPPKWPIWPRLSDVEGLADNPLARGFLASDPAMHPVVQGFDFRTTFSAREDIAKSVLPSGRLYCVFMATRLSTIMARSSSRIPRHVSTDGHAMTRLVVANVNPISFSLRLIETEWYNFATVKFTKDFYHTFITRS